MDGVIQVLHQMATAEVEIAVLAMEVDLAMWVVEC